MNTESFSPPNYYALLYISCGIVLGCYFGTYMRFPVVPLFAQSLGADTTQVGLINGAFLLAAGTLSLPLGLVAPRLGMKRLSLAGLLMLAVSSFLLAVSSTPSHLIWIYLFSGVSYLVLAGLLGIAASLAGYGLSRSLLHFELAAMAMGISMGLAFTAVAAFCIETVRPEFRGLAMGGYNSALYLGMMLSSAGLGPVVGRLGYQYGFLLTALISLLLTGVSAWLMQGFPSDKSFHNAKSPE